MGSGFVGDVGSVGAWLAWVKFQRRWRGQRKSTKFWCGQRGWGRFKIQAWVTWVKHLAWVLWVHKILAPGSKDGVGQCGLRCGLNVLQFHHTLKKTLSSIECDLIIPTKFNNLYCFFSSYFIYFLLLYANESDLLVMNFQNYFLKFDLPGLFFFSCGYLFC